MPQNPDSCPVPTPYPFGDDIHTLDLEPGYRRARQQGPVTRVELPHGGMAWLVTDHSLVRRVLVDQRAFSRAAANRADVARVPRELMPEESILAMDPPRHTLLRSAVAAMFGPSHTATFEPMVTETAQQLLTTFTAGRDTGDAVADYFAPFTAEVIGQVLEIPEPERTRAFELGLAMTSRTNGPATVAHSRTQFEAMLYRLAARGHGGELLAQLGGAVDGEILNLVMAVLIAARPSMTGFLASATLALLRDEAPYQQLVEDPSCIPDAAEELLRSVPLGLTGTLTRVALQDTQLGPVWVRAGEAVIPDIHAGNRDPEAFSDPDTLDLRRSPNPHMAFGNGVHFCLGAALARLEIRAVLSALTTRLPALRLTGTPPTWRPGARYAAWTDWKSHGRRTEDRSGPLRWQRGMRRNRAPPRAIERQWRGRAHRRHTPRRGHCGNPGELLPRPGHYAPKRDVIAARCLLMTM